MNLVPNHEIYFTAEELADRIGQLGRQISADFAGSNGLKVVVPLKGSFIFAADLVRSISLPVKMDFIEVSSYGGGLVSSGNIKLLKDLSHDIAGEDVLVVEDILDTGLTLSHLVELLASRKPRSISLVVLLVKEKKHQLEFPVRYAGFEIGDDFVIGYGLDYQENYRQLPYIARLV